VSTALVVAPIHPPDQLAERWQFYARQTKSLNTIRAYRADWQDFQAWCQRQRSDSLPAGAATIAAYVTCLADQGSKASTIQRRLTTISQMHDTAGFESPTKTKLVRTTMSGIRRTIGVAQIGKRPLLTSDVRAMCDALADDLTGRRDRAVLLVGFAGGFRRSELAALRWQDIAFRTEGLIVSLMRSKTDQEAIGRKVGIPFGSNPSTCPVRGLAAWRDARVVHEGPVFCAVDWRGEPQLAPISGKMVATIIKRTAKRVGLEPAHYAGHSLRSGLATQAAMNGASERVIMNQTGHRSLNTVRRYIRQGSLFRENAAFHLGL
jgi:site-specific recombinase XerD